MISGTCIADFKGIGERVQIDLRPLTLLFAANNAGKSLVTRALHYVREVFVRRNLNADFTESGDESIDPGGFRNVVHQRDVSRAATFQFQLEFARQALAAHTDVCDQISEFTGAFVEDLANAVRKASVKFELE